MSELLVRLRQTAAAAPRRILLPETQDSRVMQAAAELARQGLARPVLLCAQDDAPPGCEALPGGGEVFETCVQALVRCRAHKGITADMARKQISDHPLLFAALCVQTGVADASVAGSVASTANVLRAALLGVGAAPGVSCVSSFFLMALTDRTLTYADCAVVPYPDSAQLADIARVSAASHQRLTGQTPRVAMLSFSTLGSAEHESVSRVREATELLRQQVPELAVDGELQFDTAFDADVARRKAPDSVVAGQANVFVFPNLDAGNIAYKITQRLGGAKAIGPLIQGLARPCMDLSRGCSVDDIIDVACVASVLADGPAPAVE